MAFIALGVTGGIGAYKAVEIARGLQKNGHDVVAVMTRSATKFVGPLTFEAITRRRSDHRSVASRAPTPTSSTSRSRRPSTCCWWRRRPPTPSASSPTASPTTFLSSLLHRDQGAGDDRAGDEHEHVRASRGREESRDARWRAACTMVDPGSGYLACGWIGKGRLAEPDDVVACGASSCLRAKTSARRHPGRAHAC